MKILIVEDNPVNAEMLRFTLEKEHYELIMARDGEEALAQIETNPDVDLVITDVMMPSMTGLEMLERIRQQPEHKTLPVVVATSLANQATVRQAVSLHCKHFIVKPFTVQLLLQTVHEAVGQRGALLEDKARVLNRIGIDADGYDQLARTFAGLVHAQVSTYRAICEHEQPVELDLSMRRDLCALEEGAIMLGAERLANLFAILGLPGGTPPTETLGATYKAILAELRLLEQALPQTPTDPGTDTTGDEPPASTESVPG